MCVGGWTVCFIPVVRGEGICWSSVRVLGSEISVYPLASDA